jgi:hypothetical protein
LTALIDLIAYEDEYLDEGKYAMVAPGTWKKFVCGNGSLKKDKQYVGKLAAAINDHPMFVGDVGDIKDDNILDAISIGITAFSSISGYARVRDIQSFAKLMEDSPKMRDYGKER